MGFTRRDFNRTIDTYSVIDKNFFKEIYLSVYKRVIK